MRVSTMAIFIKCSVHSKPILHKMVWMSFSVKCRIIDVTYFSNVCTMNSAVTGSVYLFVYLYRI
jgi:hypothetical protein